MFYEHLMGFHKKGEKHGFNHLISNNKIQKLNISEILKWILWD